MICVPSSYRQILSQRWVHCFVFMLLNLCAFSWVWAQPKQLVLPQFVGVDLITQNQAPSKLYQLLTFQGSKEWNNASITWTYPLTPEDEEIWGASVPIENSERFINDRISALKRIDLEQQDPEAKALILPMQQAALELELRGDEGARSVASYQALYPTGFPPRVISSESSQFGSRLYSYSKLVPNTWVLWFLTPRSELKESDYARYARIFSTLKENSRPQDQAILIEGEDQIESTSSVPLIEDWTPEQWTKGFKAKKQDRTSRKGVAKISILRSIMRNLIHQLHSNGTRCGQPCQHLIPNVNILIFADKIEPDGVNSLQSLVQNKTNIFYGAHLIQVKMSQEAIEDQQSVLSELRLANAPPNLPYVVTQSSLSEVFKQIIDWRDQQFVVQPLSEFPLYYWSKAKWKIPAEIHVDELGVGGRVHIELPQFEPELSITMKNNLTRFEHHLSRLRQVEIAVLSQRKIERTIVAGILFIAFLIWLILLKRKNKVQNNVLPNRKVTQQPSPTPLIQTDEINPQVFEPASDEKENSNLSDENSDQALWADHAQSLPPRSTPVTDHQDGAGPYIPTTSDHADAEEKTHSPSHEVPIENLLDEEVVKLNGELGESSNPWYDRPESAPPSEHGARLAQDEFIHYESDPPTSSTGRSYHSELNTAPYGASIVIRVDEAALFALHGPLKGRVFRINRSPALVGRGRGVDCKLPPLDDLAISRSHCTMSQKSSDAWEIVCTSPAGLYVNHALLREGETQTLYDKDLLTLGHSRFRFRVGPIGAEDYE